MKRSLPIIAFVIIVSAAMGAIILPLGLMDLVIYAPVAVIALGFFIVSFVRPFWGYLLFSLVMPLQSEEFALLEIGGAVIRVADVAILPVFIGWLLTAWSLRKENPPVRITGLEFPLLVLSAYIVLSSFWSTSLLTCISKTLQLIYAIILFYMTIDLIQTRKDLVLVLWAWVIGGVILAGTTIYSALTSVERAVSVMAANSLTTGEYLNYPIFIGVGMFLALKSKWEKTTILFMVAVCMFALSATAARGPIIAFSFTVFFFIIVSPEIRKATMWIPVILIIMVTITAVWSIALNFSLVELVEGPIIRFMNVLEDPMSDLGVWFRVSLWQAAWILFWESPIIGIGIGSLSDKMYPHLGLEFGHTQVLHNLYYEILLLFGILGFALFIWLVIRMIIVLNKIWQEVKDAEYHLLLMGITGALFSQAVGWATYGKIIENRVFWICLALAIVVGHLYQNKDGRSKIQTARMTGPLVNELEGV